MLIFNKSKSCEVHLAAVKSAALEEIDHKEQDDRTPQRYQESRYAEVVLVDRADPKIRGYDVTGYERADDAHDDIEEDALLGIRLHDDTGYPTN